MPLTRPPTGSINALARQRDPPGTLRRSRAGAGLAPLMRVSAPASAGDSDALRALERAVRSVGPRKLRVTMNRRRVLECLLRSEQPMSAYAVLRRLRVDRPRTAPLSVYRALDFLFRYGFVNRIELLNAYVARLERGADRPRQVLVCAACGLVEEVGDHAVASKLRQLARRRGFRIDRQVVELSGRCAKCAS